MDIYRQIFTDSFLNYGAYVWDEITFSTSPWYVNYFYWLILISLVVWGLEIMFPWRKNQALFRKDFWLDIFYMFFNFYLFNLIIFIAVSNVTKEFFAQILGGDLSRFMLYDTSQLPDWLQLIVFFIAVDFIQWVTHLLLHRINFLWNFHKVHHSVEEMGFAAHLRYHWMENVIYSPMKYLMMMVIGNFGQEQTYLVYYLSIAIGHLNHANVKFNYGPLKYLFNNPRMHIWHHSKNYPPEHRYGANFGISLSIWDYLFKTAWVPDNGRDIKLGFDNLNRFPKDFMRQLFQGFRKERND